MEDEYKQQPVSARSQLSHETSTSMSVTSDMSWLLSLNAGNSMAVSKMNIDVMCNPETFDKNSRPMTKGKVHKKKKEKLTRAEALALSLGMRKGSKDHRLNSPYAAGSYKPAFLNEPAALVPSAPSQKKGKSQKLSSKHSKVSPITQIYKNIRDGRQGEKTVLDLAEQAESLMHTMGSKEKHTRMMALVHAHKDKKPWIIPKIDPKAEFGGGVAGTDRKYSEYYKYKLGIRDKQASEPDIFHEEHNLSFKETPLVLTVDTDAPPIHRDPLYRIMREEAELHILYHSQQQMQPSTIKSVPPKPLPAYIDGLSRYVLQAKALDQIKSMLKPNTEVWTVMRAVCFLFVCFHETVVLDNPSESQARGFAMQSMSTVGSKAGDTKRSDSENAVQDLPAASDIPRGSRQLAEFWSSFEMLVNEFMMNSANFVNVFTWEFVVKLLSKNNCNAMIQLLDDIEKGAPSKPIVLKSDIVIGMRSVNWRTGMFYHKVANTDYMCASLRVVASNACFTPDATFKAHPGVASLCQWSRNIITGVFATKAILSRVAARFPAVSQKPALTKHLEAPLDEMSVLSDEMLMQQSVVSVSAVSEGSSILAAALGNIASTIPGSHEEHILATQRTGNLQKTLNMQYGRPMTMSPKKRIGHFIETSTLQSNVLNNNLSADIMAKTNELILSDQENTVAHRKNSKVDNMSEIHVVGYLPVIDFPTSLTEIEESGSEFNVGVPLCALATARPCDRVDLLLGTRYVKKSDAGIDSVLKNHHRNEIVARTFFSHMIMAKTCSPLHQVYTSPYDDADRKGGMTGSRPSTEGENGTAESRVSFKYIQEVARKASSVHETNDNGALELEESKKSKKSKESKESNNTGASVVDSLLADEDSTRTGNTTLKAVETREDFLYEFLRGALMSHNNQEKSRRRNSQAYTSVKKSTFVFIKELHQVFIAAHEDLKLPLPSIVMLAPQCLQKGISWPTINRVSRFVCCLGTGSLDQSAFQTTLRLAKPGDLIFLVHIVQRKDELTGHGDSAAAGLVAHYQSLGFNLHISLESQLIPPGPDANTQFSKAILAGAMMHNPTHIVLGADDSEIQFSFTQTSTRNHDENPSVVESIIRHEKYLSTLRPEIQDVQNRRPVLVLTNAK